jgi:Holliday junction resolvasome RuvABC ATP-dependent DNA helicase subunit
LTKNQEQSFIPQEYRVADEKSRLEILAGLLDTDGHLHFNTFDYVSKSKKLAEDVCFIARSLGFKVTFSEKIIQYKGESRLYYRLCISGDTDKIPTKVKRKQATSRRQCKNPLVFGFTVEKDKVDDYYGFNLDGDHLYLTEDFLVHHNCGKSMRVEAAAEILGCTDENGKLVRLNAECIDNGDDLAKLLEERLSWKGYLCDNGCIDHTVESGCINERGERTCKIVDPKKVRGPIEQTAVFIDEIHVLSKSVQEQIGLILLDFRYQYKKKDGSVKDMYFPKFTCFGATTVLGDLLTPLQTRFGNQIEVEAYSDEEMIEIIKSMASGRGWEITDEAATILGLCSQGVARMGENHIRGLYEAACYYRNKADNEGYPLSNEDKTKLTKNLALKYIKTAKYREDGLKDAQIRALEFLYKRGKNLRTDQYKPIGEQAICDNLNIDKESFRRNIEPRLIVRSLIERTARGRSITDKGVKYLKSILD